MMPGVLKIALGAISRPQQRRLTPSVLLPTEIVRQDPVKGMNALAVRMGMVDYESLRGWTIESTITFLDTWLTSDSGWRQKEESDPDLCQRHETFPKPGFHHQIWLVRCKWRVNSL